MKVSARHARGGPTTTARPARGFSVAPPDSVEDFERAFARYIGVRHALAVSSGTAGLMVAMMATVSRPGQRVLTTPLTFASTANSALIAGGVPIFSDVDPESLDLDPRRAREAGSSLRGPVVPVHLYGFPAEIDEIRRATGRRRYIIEDAAQALGAKRDGKMVGSLADLAVFSFYSAKHIALGEGGMITTDSDELARKCRAIRSHGQERKYYHTQFGYNFRLPPVLAELGLEQLASIESDLARREELARIYRDELRGTNGIRFPERLAGIRHANYRFPTVLDPALPMTGQTVAEALTRKSRMDVGRGYGLLVYQQPFYRNISKTFWGAELLKFPDYRRVRCPIAERVVDRLVELPTDASVDEKAARSLSRALRAIVERAG